MGLGIINEATNSAIILVAIVSCTLSPVLFNRLLPPQPAPERQGVILVGLGELSALLAERLRQAGEQVTLIGLNRERVEEMKRRDLPVIKGNPADPSVLERAGAASAAALVSLTARDGIDLAACRLAGERFNIPNRVAMVSDQTIAAQMSDLGVRVVHPQMATALALEGALHFPSAFDMLTDHTDGVEIREGVLNNPPLEGRPLRRVKLPGDVLILGMRRGDDVLVPHGNTRLRQGDVLMLVGHPDELHQAVAWLCPPCF